MARQSKRPSVNKGRIQPEISNVEYSTSAKRARESKTYSNSRYSSNTGNNSKKLISRRKFIYGAIGAGALVVGAAGAKYVGDKVTKNTSPLNVINPKKSNINTQESYKDLGNNTFMNVIKEIQMEYGTLAWANNSNTICCLIPTNKAKPLTVVDVINMKSNNQTRIIENPVSQKEAFEIYDVRANDDCIIWTEENILQGEWRIYASAFKNGYEINPTLIDVGNNNWETPTIGVSKNYAYWQINPKKDGPTSKLLAHLKQVNCSSLSKNNNYLCKDISNNSEIESNPQVVKTSNGRMATPIYSYNDGVVITPRADSNLVYYELTYINNSGQTVDSLILPQSITPAISGYGKTGFDFTLDAIYNTSSYSNIGTYTPSSKTSDYNNCEWFNFSRNPSAAPCWCNDYFLVRSTMAICAVNLSEKSYCVLERPNNSEDYGDYLASTGICDKIVSYANIHEQPISGEDKKYCSLRIWEKV